MAQPWRMDSWRGKPILQVPEYPDLAALEEVERNLRNYPPLVFIKEVRSLKEKLAGVAQGNGFALPEYVEIERNGPDHAPHFTSEVRIKGKTPACGKGASKRAAEQAAARALLEQEGVRETAAHE